jgi:hypothetical protein
VVVVCSIAAAAAMASLSSAETRNSMRSVLLIPTIVRQMYGKSSITRRGPLVGMFECLVLVFPAQLVLTGQHEPAQHPAKGLDQL